MKRQQMIIGIVVGYMLKVMKAQKTEMKFKQEFACIRHGNYPDFISLVKGCITEMVVYRDGVIKVNPNPREDDLGFIGLVMAGPSMKVFYEKCIAEYGIFVDKEVSDKIYYQLAIYEITIRIHANKFKSLEKSETFQTIIHNLGKHLALDEEDVTILQNGRKLLNMVKHGRKKNYSWIEAITDFEKAFQLTEEKNITLE
ncbi:hypothetical protein [Maribacter sp. R86514]|uniref:hypothetical protein n=1 Tax=Maribacter sp. R86514 TaxID=3093854 RepID=UPI0037C64ABE